jgi:hypothetical protein
MSGEISPIVITLHPGMPEGDAPDAVKPSTNPYYGLDAPVYSTLPEKAVPIFVTLHPDPLQSDPTARGISSRNSASSIHEFPTPAQESPLARPEVVDALEAVDILARPTRENETDLTAPTIPLDLKLARRGLSTLRAELGDQSNRTLRLAVTDTSPSRLAAYLEQTAADRQLKQAALQDQSSQQQTIEQAQEARRIEREEERARQAEYRHEFAQVLGIAGEAVPAYSAQSLLEIAEEMIISEGTNGLTVTVESSFLSKISAQVEGFLAEPQQLYDVMKLGATLGKHGLSPREEQIYLAYTTTINDAINAAIERRNYSLKEFTPELMAKWQSLRAHIDADIPIDDLASRVVETGDPDLVAFTSCMPTQMRILSASLQAFARNHPKQFMDKFYLFVDAGIDPDDEVRNNYTRDTVMHCLANEPEAGFIINLMSLSDRVENRRKAADLEATLSVFSVPKHYLGRGRKGKLSAQIPGERREAIKKACAPYFIVGYSDFGDEAKDRQLAQQLAQELNDFHEEARTVTEEEADTIFGRLVSALTPKEEDPTEQTT